MDSAPLEECPLTAAVDVVGGKWKLIVLYALSNEPRRFNELQRLTPGVSHQVLSRQLRELEDAGVVSRHDAGTANPHVSYRLTEYGETLRPVLDALVTWGNDRLAPHR